MSEGTVIHWFRRDLRLSDNRALNLALRSGQRVLGLFIFDPQILESPFAGAARIAFMLKGLRELDRQLQAYGSALWIEIGNPEAILAELTEKLNVQALYMNKDYTPYARKRDEKVSASLAIPVYSEDDALLVAPPHLLKQDGQAYTVFTPFYKKWLTLDKTLNENIAIERGPFLESAAIQGKSIPTLAALGFNTSVMIPEAGEQAARAKLDAFIENRITQYAIGRDVLSPALEKESASSQLSHHLHLGFISIREVYHRARLAEMEASPGGGKSIEAWLRELAWRDFYTHILYHFPQVKQEDFRNKQIQWQNSEVDFEAWKNGQTGYPIVDALMRQLKESGWIANRSRMIVASFLTKHLLIHWKKGETYFMQQLLDGDVASNNGGWQWIAGTGTDAQPYFRIFNPILQSKRFDPQGITIRQWLPELGHLLNEDIHTPWLMKSPPKAYPAPIIDHAWARSRALQAYNKL
ncbi:deoxyribodipyrimidine photo-lyase [Anaerolineales bacterium]